MSDDSKKNVSKKKTSRITAPAKTPEAQEQKMINLAMREAEKQLENGTASSQIITHFLNLATQKTYLEREKLKAETEMAKAKVEVMQSQKHSEELYEKAIKAFKSYGGATLNNLNDEDDELYEE